MPAIHVSNDELHTICQLLQQECGNQLAVFEQASQQSDTVSKQRAIRAANEARRIGKLLAQIQNYLDGSCLSTRGS